MRNERRTACATYGELDANVVAVANHIHAEGATPRPFLAAFLGEIDAKFPGLSFHDFCAAVRLSGLVKHPPRGSA
jgi:hypothetical protein